MERFIDVSDVACEAGFACPVAVFQEVWDRCIEWTQTDNDRQGYQEQDARMWDVLFVPSMKLRMADTTFGPDGCLRYQIYCLLRGEGRDATLITLKAEPVTFEGDIPGLIISF